MRLVHWEPKPAPVVLTHYSVVTDVDRFIRMTILELKAALVGKRWQAGHRSVRDLVDRLQQCGVRVEVSAGETLRLQAQSRFFKSCSRNHIVSSSVSSVSKSEKAFGLYSSNRRSTSIRSLDGMSYLKRKSCEAGVDGAAFPRFQKSV